MMVFVLVILEKLRCVHLSGGVRFELGSWSRLVKFLPTVAGQIGLWGLENLVLHKERTSWHRIDVFC